MIHRRVCAQAVGAVQPDPTDSCTRSSVEVSWPGCRTRRTKCLSSGKADLVFECVCVCVYGKVMRGRQHDWWHLGVIVIESITPHSTLCQGDTHTHIHELSHGSF